MMVDSEVLAGLMSSVNPELAMVPAGGMGGTADLLSGSRLVPSSRMSAMTKEESRSATWSVSSIGWILDEEASTSPGVTTASRMLLTMSRQDGSCVIKGKSSVGTI